MNFPSYYEAWLKVLCGAPHGSTGLQISATILSQQAQLEIAREQPWHARSYAEAAVMSTPTCEYVHAVCADVRVATGDYAGAWLSFTRAATLSKVPPAVGVPDTPDKREQNMVRT